MNNDLLSILRNLPPAGHAAVIAAFIAGLFGILHALIKDRPRAAAIYGMLLLGFFSILFISVRPTPAPPPVSLPAYTSVLLFDASDNPAAFREFQDLLAIYFPRTIIFDTYEFMNRWTMPRTRIYFVQPKYQTYAQQLSNWLPGVQDVFDYSHQENALMPERPNGPIANIVVADNRNLVIFLGNDYEEILALLRK